MKKNMLKSIFLATILSFCTVVSTPIAAKESVNAATLDPTFAIVNDFEKIDDLYTIGMYGSFGVVDLNTDSAYVTNGNASMRLNPIGDYHMGKSPTYIKLHLNKLKGYDASKMTSVSFDAFNASDKDGKISCALAIDGTNTKYVDFFIAKNEKKTIELEYDLVAMSAVYDVSKVEGIYVKLPKAINRETQAENIWYIDNFCAKYTPFESKGYEIALEENEFCNFDKRYQEYFVNTNCGTGAIDGYRPELSLNANPLYCADRNEEGFVYGKNQSLKVVVKGGASSGGPGFTFFDDLWHSFDWKNMNDKAFTFEVYNDSESTFRFSFILFRNPDNYRDNYYDRYSKSFEVPAYSWKTISLSIQEWNESAKNTNGNPLDSYVQLGKVVYTYQIPYFGYSNAAVGDVDRTFYFDNFRFTDVGV